MKEKSTVTMNMASMLTALQAYFDGQLKDPHKVLSVKTTTPSSGYNNGPVTFEVELEETAAGDVAKAA